MANFDLVLLFPHENKCLYAHRDFLAAESPIFRRLIYEDPTKPKTEIQISDVNSTIVQHALQCISTAGNSLASVRLSVLLRRFATDYEMKTLFSLCGIFLTKHLSSDNVEVIHDLACHCSDTVIQFFCWLKFDIFWREIFSRASFYKCSESTIKRFVSRPIYRDIDEFFLWNALYTWGLTKMLHENSIENPVLHRNILEEFLPQIRFLVMKSEELNAVFNSKILSMEECSAIKLAYETKDVSTLPPSICRLMVTRTSINLSQHVKHIYSHFCPKHTNARIIRANDHFYAEFTTSHDYFLIGVVLPVSEAPNASPLLGEMEVSVTDLLSNKKEVKFSWKLAIPSRTIRLFAPVFIERNCKVCINLSILEGNLHWQIDFTANCDIGQLGKDICDKADMWQSFYFKEPLLYF